MSLRRIAVVLALPGALLVALGLILGPDVSWAGIEGAYFTRASGTPAYSGVFTTWGDGPQLFSPQDGNLWIGAGIACLAIAAGALLAHRAGLRIVRGD